MPIGRGGRHRTRKAVSQAQAHFLGIIAGGGHPRGGAGRGLSQAKAKDKLRGVKVKRLPKRVRHKATTHHARRG